MVKEIKNLISRDQPNAGTPQKAFHAKPQERGSNHLLPNGIKRFTGGS